MRKSTESAGHGAGAGQPESEAARQSGAGTRIVALPELLMPAGSFEAGVAALEGGADALYLGFGSFSARKAARNFGPEEYRRILHLARHGQKRIYVAMNTLVFEEEYPAAAGLLAFLSDYPPDAIILQDWGLVRLIRRSFPELAMHASTQMAIQTPEAARIAQEAGITRIVLPREIGLAGMRRFVEAVPGMEFEVFVHGALCYSYSGLCNASALLLGRSANRGECAQLCRSRYERVLPRLAPGRAGPAIGDPADGSGYWFSCKDLDLSGRLADLADCGIASLKVEGRMKGPEYCHAVARRYRLLLDGLTTTAPVAAEPGRFRKTTGLDLRTREEARLTFARQPTEAYLDSAAGRDLIDAGFPGQRGIPIGTVYSCRSAMPAFGHRESEAAGLPFEIGIDLEGDLGLRDGLMIFDKPEPAEPARFSVQDIKKAQEGRPVFRAVQGERIIVPSPVAVPPGTRVHKLSSRSLDRRKVAPEEYPPAMLEVGVELSVEEGRFVVRPIPKETIEADGAGGVPAIEREAKPRKTSESRSGLEAHPLPRDTRERSALPEALSTTDVTESTHATGTAHHPATKNIFPQSDVVPFQVVPHPAAKRILWHSDILPFQVAKMPGGFQKACSVFAEAGENDFRILARLAPTVATGPGLPEGIRTGDLFLPPSLLKQEKNRLYEAVAGFIQSGRENRATQAVKDLGFGETDSRSESRSVDPDSGVDTEGLTSKATAELLDAGCAPLPERQALVLAHPDLPQGMPFVTPGALVRNVNLPELAGWLWMPLAPLVRDWKAYASLVEARVAQELAAGRSIALGLQGLHHLALARTLVQRFAGATGTRIPRTMAVPDIFTEVEEPKEDTGSGPTLAAGARLAFFGDSGLNVATSATRCGYEGLLGLALPSYPCAERIRGYRPPVFISAGCLYRHASGDRGCHPDCPRSWVADYHCQGMGFRAIIEDCCTTVFMISDTGDRRSTGVAEAM